MLKTICNREYKKIRYVKTIFSSQAIKQTMLD